MKVEVDTKSGFCFGVQNAVEIAEKALIDGNKVFSLGSIVHNDVEVERLSGLGLETIDHKRFKELTDSKVLIRAHGEPPETYALAEQNNITIIEATCPIVKKLQSRIKTAWLASGSDKGQIVIYGKQGHAEVIGLMGQINNEAILVSGLEDVHKINPEKPVHLFSQTTMPSDIYALISEKIALMMREKGNNPDENLKVHRTICGQVSGREPNLINFAKKHDVIIFVSGKESSNGKMLYNICKSVNPRSYFVSTADDIDRTWFDGIDSAGVCGATSTPKWLIEDIKDFISNI